MESSKTLWERAQRAESQGGRREARALYERILEIDPHHVPARLRMSRLDQFADRYHDSRQHALIAADVCQAIGGGRNAAYVTSRLLEFSEPERVANIVNAADPSDQVIIKQSPTLAQHLSLTGRYDDTLRFLDAIATQVGSNPFLLVTRANVLRYLGDMNGAERAYEQCLAIAPMFADAHLALATHSRAHPPLSRVERVQRALSQSPQGGTEEAQLSYALFHEFDAADEIELAWSALARGLGNMKRRIAYEPQLEAQRLSNWMEFMPERFQPEATANTVPIFVVGMPRTGTTLVDRMLSNHSDVGSAGELNDFAAAVSEATGRFFASAAHSQLAGLPGASVLQRIGALYLERLQRKARNARFVIDKNPQNLFNVPLILGAIPQARVLCLLRRPMDACFSNLKELFHGGAYAYSYAMDDVAGHYLRVVRWMNHWQRAFPEAFGIVSYENLVTHPEKSVEGLQNFLGLDLQADLHDVTRNREPVATASSSQVRQQVNDRAVGAWHRYAEYLRPLQKCLGA